MAVDYIIVGQGLAGSILADHLISAGCSVMVYDDPALSNCSKIAGGLYNPVTGRVMVKTWKAEELFGYLTSYYPDFESRIDGSFINDIPIYRPFISAEELNEWMGKSADIDYGQFLKSVHNRSAYGSQVNDDFGGLLLNQSGFLDTSALLKASAEWLQKKKYLSRELFDADELTLSKTDVTYKGMKAKAVIFCNGHKALEQQYFNWIPLRPVKGELLIIKTEEELEVIHNRGVFVIPQKHGLCKVGATYDHQNLDEIPTEGAKSVLNAKLKELVKFPYEIVDQLAGVRPATKDRRPIIGQHPKESQLLAFNGFGTKGVSLIPFYANQMTNHLINGNSLDAEVNIERFFSLT